MKKIFLILSTILATVAAVSCQDTDETELVATTGVTLSATEVSIFPGEQVELKATLTPDNCTSSYKTWVSSDAKVATVDVWGRVVGLTPGVTTITVTTASGKCTADCKVTVKEIPVTGVTLNKTTATVYIGENIDDLTATITPENASDKTITWTSSNSEIAAVDENGKVTGVEIGKATITATTKNGISASCEVTVNVRTPTEPEQITLWKSDKAGYRGLFGADADNGKTAGIGGWLSYKDGVAYWTENTTGAARKATLELSTGSKITVSQVDAKDLAGNYTLYNNSYKASNVSATKIVGTRVHETAVEFKTVENPTTLNGHVHNLDLVGLYLDFAVPASLEIVDGTPVIYTYLSLDYQKVSNGKEVACITQLTNSTTYGSNIFAPLKFGVNDCNYAWIGWGVDDLFGAPKFGIGTPTQRLVSEGMYFCGFSFVTKGYTEGGYSTIYQLNYNNKWTYDGSNGGAYFAKK